MSTENRPAELKKLPVAPSKWKAREILQKCGFTFREANKKILESIVKYENISEAEAKKVWYLKIGCWKDLLSDVIHEEDLFTIGYKR